MESADQRGVAALDKIESNEEAGHVSAPVVGDGSNVGQEPARKDTTSPQDELAAFEALRLFAEAWDACGFYPDTSREIEALHAVYIKALVALSAAAKPVEPEGWKLVPVEPTPEMLRAIRRQRSGARVGKGDRADWAAWLTAAPSAPGAEQAKPAEAMTEREIQSLVTEYGPQSDDEEIGFRDGIRTAQRHLAAAWGVKLEGGEA